MNSLHPDDRYSKLMKKPDTIKQTYNKNDRYIEKEIVEKRICCTKNSKLVVSPQLHFCRQKEETIGSARDVFFLKREKPFMKMNYQNYISSISTNR